MEEDTKYRTAAKIAELMRMPCDKHMCDSGYSYGYAYEKRQNLEKENKDVIACEKEDGKLTVSVTKSMYHFLCDHLSYDPVLTAALDAYREETKGDLWGTELTEGFAAKLSDDYASDNTYNCENLLDGVFLFTRMSLRDKEFIILSTHNGCDVRSGYSEPAVFLNTGAYEGDETASFWIGLSTALLACQCGCDKRDYIEIDGSSKKLSENEDAVYIEDGNLMCGICKHKFEVL